VRQQPEHRNARLGLDPFDPRLEDRAIAAELRDDDAADPSADVVGNQFDRPEDRREHAAALDVGDEQHVGVGKAGRLDVRQIAVVEVDLRDRAGPLRDHHVVCRRQPLVCRRGGRRRPIPVGVVVLVGGKMPDGCPIEDEL